MKQIVSSILVAACFFSSNSYAVWPEVLEMFGKKKSIVSCPNFDKRGGGQRLPRGRAKNFTGKTPSTEPPECETAEYEKYTDINDDIKKLREKRKKISGKDTNDYDTVVKRKYVKGVTGPLGTLMLPKFTKVATKNQEKIDDKNAELAKIDAEIADKKAEAKEQLNYWKMLCIKKNTPSSCDIVKANFRNTISEDSFEALIKTVAAVQIRGEGREPELIYLSTDDIKDKKKWGEIKDHMDKDRIEALEPKIKKAQAASETYEKQKKGEAVEKRFESVCGGCSDIENMLKDASTSTANKIALIGLGKTFKCKIQTIESCDKDKEFNKSATSIEALLKNPNDKDANFQLERAYNKLKSVNDASTGEPCMSCDQFVDMRLDLPDESAQNLDPFLKKIGCPLPPKAEPTCKEAVDTLTTLSNDPDFDPDVIDPKYQGILQDVSEQNCCKELPAVQAVKNEVKLAKSYSSLKVIDKSANFKVSKALDCIMCEDITDEDQKPKVTTTGQKANSCDFFTKNNGKVITFLCADGPPAGNKCTPGNAKFTQSAYGSGGKYGELTPFNLKCFCDPGNGESVNATCCTMSNKQKVDKFGKTLTTTQVNGGNELYTPADVGIFKAGQKEATKIDSIEALCGWGISQLKTNYNEFMKNRTAICYEVNEKQEKGEVLGSVFEKEVEVFGSSTKESPAESKGGIGQ